MVATLAVTVAIGAASVLFSTLFRGAHDFVPGACDRLEPYLASELVGQDLGVHQVCDAICDHLAEAEPQKPLVISAHGPPGVGKSMLHLLLARALYNKKPADNLPCPGDACLGYKVLYGMDYVAKEREEQHQLLKAGIMDHIRLHPQSLVVIEEYDKLDCPTRGLLKQLVDSSHSTNVSINRSIIMLESNTGFPELHQMLVGAGSRRKVTAEAAQRLLKDLMFNLWSRKSCEASTDTVKLLSLIDFYLPFLPLEREHIRELFEMRLKERQEEVLRTTKDALTWGSDVLDFLTSRVDFEGQYPIEGAKEVRTLMTRHVTRALRDWARLKAAHEAKRKALDVASGASGSKKKIKPLPPRELPLMLNKLGTGLEIAAAL